MWKPVKVEFKFDIDKEVFPLFLICWLNVIISIAILI